jgi:hypothetical protein
VDLERLDTRLGYLKQTKIDTGVVEEHGLLDRRSFDGHLELGLRGGGNFDVLLGGDVGGSGREGDVHVYGGVRLDGALHGIESEHVYAVWLRYLGQGPRASDRRFVVDGQVFAYAFACYQLSEISIFVIAMYERIF